MQFSSTLLIACGLFTITAAALAGHVEHRHVEQQHLRVSGITPITRFADEPKKMDAITEMRAEMCSDMKDEHGDDFDSMEACIKFMNEACKPGKDGRMDGDGKEVSTGKGHCEKFFPADGKKPYAEEEAAAPAPAFALPTIDPKVLNPFAGPAPAAAAVEKKDDAAVKDEKAASAPAAAAPPAAAPAPGSEWIHSMDEEKPIASQGFQGKPVEHNDKSTVTDDWREEFGPNQDGQQNVLKICLKNPDNLWCRKHMPKKVQAQPPHPFHAGAEARSGAAAVFLAVAMSAFMGC